MSHNCTQEKRCEKMEAAVFGKEGVLVMIAELKTTMNNTNETLAATNATLKDVNKVQRVVLKFMDEEKTKEKVTNTIQAEKKIRFRWMVGTAIALLSLIGSFIVVILSILKHFN